MAEAREELAAEQQDTEGLSRRGFFGMMGAAAMAATIPVIAAPAAQALAAEEKAAEGDKAAEGESKKISNTDIEEGSADVSPVQRIGQGNDVFIHRHLDEIVEELKQIPVATEDLTLPDGTVIDKAYVTMFNRYNHLGEGLNGTPGVGSFDLLTSMYSVEDAEVWNTLPLFERYTAAAWAEETGRTEEEARAILDDFASRRLIDKFLRENGDLYFTTPYAGGIRIRLYRDFTPEVLRGCDTLRGVEKNTTSQYPVYAVCPVGPEVVDSGEVMMSRDWRSQIENSFAWTAQPCGCRNSAILKGEMEEMEEGIRHCMVFGDLAQYFIDNGLPPLTKEEVLAEADKLIDLGYVPEMVFAENPDVMCFCKAERCTMLTAHRNADGQTVSFSHASGAYLLQYNQDACIQCESCVSRCPMHSVSIDDDGYPTIDAACVGCGQCVLVCPAQARILTLKPEENIPDLPADLCEQAIWQAADRYATRRIVDFEGTELPEYAINISTAANASRDEKYHWLIDTKPHTLVENVVDGTYTATRGGIQGPLTLTVEIEGGAIKDIQVGENFETETIGSVAIDTIPPAIVAANSLDVDTVSGATHTSIAIFKAVSDCLVQAGATEA